MHQQLKGRQAAAAAAARVKVASSLRRDFRHFTLEKLPGAPTLVCQQGRIAAYATDGDNIYRVADPENTAGWVPSQQASRQGQGRPLSVIGQVSGCAVVACDGAPSGFFDDGNGNFSRSDMLVAGTPCGAPVIARGPNGNPAVWTVWEDEGQTFLMVSERGASCHIVGDCAPIVGVGTDMQRRAAYVFLRGPGSMLMPFLLNSRGVLSGIPLVDAAGNGVLGPQDLVMFAQEVGDDPGQNLPVLIRANRAGQSSQSLMVYDPFSHVTTELGAPTGFGPASASSRPVAGQAPLVEVYAISTEGVLHHCRQLQDRSWGEPVVLKLPEFGDRRATAVSTSRDRDGVVRALVMLDDQSAFVVWQDPTSGDTAWQVRPVEIDSESAFVNVQAYVSEISINDERGIHSGAVRPAAP